MNKKLTTTWIILIVLTIASAFTSKLEGQYIAFAIMIFAVLKFIGISFQFIELKKAHLFWKIILLVYLVFFVSFTLILI